MESPQLRPIGIGEILDVAFKIYTRNALTLLKIGLVVVVPIQILAGLVLLGTVDDPGLVGFSPELGDASDSEVAGAVAGNVISTLVGAAAVLLVTVGCVKAVGDAYLGKQPNWRESLAFARGRFGAVLWLTVLTGLLLILTLAPILTFPVTIWLYVAWSVAYPVLLLEGVRGRKALGRSFRLVRRRWWPTFATLLVASVLAAIVGFVVGVPLGIALIFAQDSVLAAVLVTTVIGAISGVVATPFQAAVTTLIYFDLRVRKEGLDMQLLAQDIGAPVPEGFQLGQEPPPPATPVPGPQAPPPPPGSPQPPAGAP